MSQGVPAEMYAKVHWQRQQMRNGRHDPTEGFIYFIGCHDDGPVKIGFAKNTEHRRTELQCGHPYDLEVIAQMPGTPADERRLHEACAHYRTRKGGEWFDREVVVALLAAGEMHFRCTITQEVLSCGEIATR